MLCEICKQKQATIHIQEISKGEKIVLHICESCATNKGLDTIGLQSFKIAEILYKLSGTTGEPLIPIADDSLQVNTSSDNKTVTTIICPKCKWDINKFQKTGRLGCENCYKTFSEILSRTLSNMHKGTLHTGKCPDLKKTKSSLLLLDILNLQKQLDLYIQREEYEKAATVRDEINKLKNETDSVVDG